MPRRRSGVKALHLSRKRQMHNLDIKTDLRKTIKKFQTAIDQKNSKDAQAALPIVFKKLDKAAKRNVLHKNTAARRKSQFSRLLASIAKAH